MTIFRKLFFSTFLSIFLVTIGGCNLSTGNPVKKVNNPYKNNNKQITITFMNREDETSASHYKEEIIKEFEHLHPNINVIDESIGDESTYIHKLRTLISQGNPPDIFYYAGTTNLLPYAKNGVIMDVTPLLEDTQWAKGINKETLKMFDLSDVGQRGIYAIPWAINYEPIYYNIDLFKKAGIDKVPENWDQFLEVIRKLKEANIIPIEVGGKDSWRIGHLHTSIFYKMVGVEKAKQIGQRAAKWTDPDVIQTLQCLDNLESAFEPNFLNIDQSEEYQWFYQGGAAMTLDGTWRIGSIPKEFIKNVGAFPFPYFSNHPNYKSNGVTYVTQWELSGKLTGEKKAATIEFVKYWTNKENQQKLLDVYKRIPVRTDVKINSDIIGPLLTDIMKFSNNIKNPGTDTFAYDPLPQVEDSTKEALIKMLLGLSPQDSATLIQNVIDNNQ